MATITIDRVVVAVPVPQSQALYRAGDVTSGGGRVFTNMDLTEWLPSGNQTVDIVIQGEETGGTTPEDAYRTPFEVEGQATMYRWIRGRPGTRHRSFWRASWVQRKVGNVLEYQYEDVFAPYTSEWEVYLGVDVREFGWADDVLRIRHAQPYVDITYGERVVQDLDMSMTAATAADLRTFLLLRFQEQGEVEVVAGQTLEQARGAVAGSSLWAMANALVNAPLEEPGTMGGAPIKEPLYLIADYTRTEGDPEVIEPEPEDINPAVLDPTYSGPGFHPWHGIDVEVMKPPLPDASGVAVTIAGVPVPDLTEVAALAWLGEKVIAGGKWLWPYVEPVVAAAEESQEEIERVYDWTQADAALEWVADGVAGIYDRIVGPLPLDPGGGNLIRAAGDWLNSDSGREWTTWALIALSFRYSLRRGAPLTRTHSPRAQGYQPQLIAKNAMDSWRFTRRATGLLVGIPAAAATVTRLVGEYEDEVVEWLSSLNQEDADHVESVGNLAHAEVVREWEDAQALPGELRDAAVARILLGESAPWLSWRRKERDDSVSD